jgi:hypothetical protein
MGSRSGKKPGTCDVLVWNGLSDGFRISGCFVEGFLGEAVMGFSSRFLKLAASAGLIAILSCGVASAQPRVNEDHHIGSGNDIGKPSNAYFARTPYTISWTAEKSDQLYEIEGKVRRLNEVCVKVYDDASGEMIASSGWKPLIGKLTIPVAGKHHIQIYAPGKWTADFKENKEMLLRAASRGELKDGVTVQDAGQNSLRTKKEGVEAVKQGVIKQIEASRGKFGDEGVAALTADAHRAGQLASDEADFAARFGALSKVTMKKMRTDPGNASKPASPTPTATGSGWDGRGLPPGMQRRSDLKVK